MGYQPRFGELDPLRCCADPSPAGLHCIVASSGHRLLQSVLDSSQKAVGLLVSWSRRATAGSDDLPADFLSPCSVGVLMRSLVLATGLTAAALVVSLWSEAIAAEPTSSEASTSEAATVVGPPLAEPTLSETELGIAPASTEPELAISGFQYPKGVAVRTVAAEPEIANPVAFTFDGDMNLYVCETFRQNHGVEDNRGHMDWLEDDLANQTVADRAAMLERYIEDDAAAYKIRPDRLRYLAASGRNDEGRYTTSTVFASFNDLVDGTAAGVLTLDNADGSRDVFFTCIPKLYRMRDGASPDQAEGPDAPDGVADSAETVLDGFGVRVTFRGHDMHGLVRGIDGKLYWSIGDRGYHVTDADGTLHHRPNCGAIFRANPDGTDFEVFAYGLRNPQELAFNDHGDLFSVDNNSDSGDRARLVHLMEGSDAGWRLYYQYREDRGPWNREAMWQPQGKLSDAAEWVAGFDAKADARTGGLDPALVQPAYILPPVENITDGPSGFVCYPGTGWGDLIAENRFLIADFRGTSSKSGVRSFSVSPSGAGFSMDDDDDQFVWQLLATDLAFGYDGSLYIMDWVDGWSGTGKGRLYEFDPPTEPTDDIAALFAEGFHPLATSRLVELVSHADRRVRLNAQWVLAERGAVEELTALATAEALPARYHGIWGLGQLVAAEWTGSEDQTRAAKTLVSLTSAESPEVRRQALRAIGWTSADLDPMTIGIDWEALAGDDEPRVVAETALTFGRLAGDVDLTVPMALHFIDLLAANDDADPALRHALCYGLSQIGRNREQNGSRERAILTAIADGSDAVQRAGAVVLRRWRSPEIHKLLEGSPVVALEAARAIYDEPIDAAMPQLAALVVDESTPEPLARRVVAANFTLAAAAGEADPLAGTDAPAATAAERLVAIAANAALPKTIRDEALAHLRNWDDPPKLDRTIGQYRASQPRELAAARPALSKNIARLLQDDATRGAALPLVGQFGLAEAGQLLTGFLADTSLPAKDRVAALQSLEAIGLSDLSSRLQSLINDESGEVRAAARDALSRVDPETAVGVLDRTLAEYGLREQQAAIATLAEMSRDDADAVLAKWLDRLNTSAGEGSVPAGIHLDLLEAAETRGTSALTSAANSYLASAGSDVAAQYRMCLEGGEAGAVADVFYGYAAAACRRCHVVNGSGAAVGPNLSEIGLQKDRQYLLESIVEPNKAIAKGFATKLLLLDDGRVLSGIVSDETDEMLTLTLPTGEKTQIEKDAIEAEKAGLSGMPADLYKSLTRREIRDLVEFLTTLTKAQAPAEEGHTAE